jgi:hypothetical protein
MIIRILKFVGKTSLVIDSCCAVDSKKNLIIVGEIEKFCIWEDSRECILLSEPEFFCYHQMITTLRFLDDLDKILIIIYHENITN